MKKLTLIWCYAVVFFLLFLCVGCISPFLTKNNLFEYQVVMRYFENSCKYIWSIVSIWCIFAP